MSDRACRESTAEAAAPGNTGEDAGFVAPVPGHWRGSERSELRRRLVAWAASALGAGEIGSSAVDVVKERAWGLVLRIRAAPGVVYVKAAGPAGIHEPALVEELSRHAPELVPGPLAVDVAQGFLILPDLGPTLREALAGADGRARWERLLPRYAELQIATSASAERWAASGLPDRQPAALAALLGALLADDDAVALDLPGGLTREEREAARARIPELAACGHELSAMPHARTIEHGDLHDGNVLTGTPRDLLFDWGDAVLGHPFVSLLVTAGLLVDDLRAPGAAGRLARLRDAYLEPFALHVPAAQLRALFPHALWAAHAAKALSWSCVAESADAGSRASLVPNVAAWIRLWLARRDLFLVERLGAGSA